MAKVKVNWVKRYALAQGVRLVTTMSFHVESELWSLVRKPGLQEGYSPAELKLMKKHLNTLHDFNVNLSWMSQRLFDSVSNRNIFDDE